MLLSTSNGKRRESKQTFEMSSTRPNLETEEKVGASNFCSRTELSWENWRAPKQANSHCVRATPVKGVAGR